MGWHENPASAFTEQGVAIDVRMEIANIYQAIAELSIKLEDKKNTPRPKIGFKRNDDD